MDERQLIQELLQISKVSEKCLAFGRALAEGLVKINFGQAKPA